MKLKKVLLMPKDNEITGSLNQISVAGSNKDDISIINKIWKKIVNIKEFIKKNIFKFIFAFGFLVIIAFWLFFESLRSKTPSEKKEFTNEIKDRRTEEELKTKQKEAKLEEQHKKEQIERIKRENEQEQWSLQQQAELIEKEAQERLAKIALKDEQVSKVTNFSQILVDINDLINQKSSNLKKMVEFAKKHPRSLKMTDLSGMAREDLLQLSKDTSVISQLAKTKGNLAQYKNWIPLQTTGDGNCFLNAFSILLVGDTSLALRLRVALCLLLIKEPWRLVGTKEASEAEQLQALKSKLVTEAGGLATDKTWLATDDINFLSVILKRPLRMLYFPLKEQLGEETYQKLQEETGGLAVLEFKSEAKDSEQIIYDYQDYWTIFHVGGNHFVPLIPNKSNQ